MNGDDNEKQQALTEADQDLAPVQGEIWPAETLIQLERDRIDSYNRRTDVARQARLKPTKLPINVNSVSIWKN